MGWTHVFYVRCPFPDLDVSRPKGRSSYRCGLGWKRNGEWPPASRDNEEAQKGWIPVRTMSDEGEWGGIGVRRRTTEGLGVVSDVPSRKRWFLS